MGQVYIAPALLSPAALANPSASVGLAAVNGVSAKAMRSDAAPALSQAIAPVWTGQHVFLFPTGTQVRTGTAVDNPNPIVGDPAHLVDIINDNSAFQVVRISTYGATGVVFQNNMHWCRYGGTVAAPTPIANGDTFMSMGYRGWDSTNALSQSAASFSAQATEAWTGAAHGIRFLFQVTPNTSIVRADALEIAATGIKASFPFLAPDGTQALPSYAFAVKPDLGMYHAGGDQARLIAKGATSLIWSDVLVAARLQFQASDGTSTALPGIAFENDTGMGWTRRAAGQMSGSVLGVETCRFDNDATAANTRFMIYDVSAGTVVRVSRGAVDSGGVGFRLLRVPN